MPTIYLVNGETQNCFVYFKGQHGIEAVVKTASGDLYSSTFVPYVQILKIEDK